MKSTDSFEDCLSRLEEIVNLLENGECPLDDTMKLYEEGIKLSGYCSKKLEKARQKMVTLTEKEGESVGGAESIETA